MRIVFWGTPDFAVPTLAALHQSHQVLAVVSQPDKRSGRRRKIQSPPTIEYARQHQIAILQPESTKDPQFRETLREYQPDVMVVVAYGKILAQKILDIPSHGCVNVHFSILPKYRGASPISTAIANGDVETGITIMKMNRKMDEGPILKIHKTPIGEDTTEELQTRLGELAPTVLLEVLERIAEITPLEQDHQNATYCHMLSKQDGEICWQRSDKQLSAFVRAMTPWPGAQTILQRGDIEDQIIIKKVAMTDKKSSQTPGVVEEVTKKEIFVATTENCLQILELQKSGKRPMSCDEFLRGNPVKIGDRFLAK